jgi:hypothetical protein
MLRNYVITEVLQGHQLTRMRLTTKDFSFHFLNQDEEWEEHMNES